MTHVTETLSVSTVDWLPFSCSDAQGCGMHRLLEKPEFQDSEFHLSHTVQSAKETEPKHFAQPQLMR